MLDKQLLSEWWPEASHRATAHLLRKGVSEADAADAVQEAAAKALTADLDPADVDELCRWVSTVAWRACVDGYRRTSRMAPAPPPDMADTADVATAVEGRIDVARTLAAMASLSPADRAALAATLAPAEQAASRKEAVRDAVRLFRARARLLAVVGKLGAAAAAAWRVVKRVFTVEPAVRAAAAAGVLAFAVLTLDLPHQPEGGLPAARPAAARRARGRGAGRAGVVDRVRRGEPGRGPAATRPAEGRHHRAPTGLAAIAPALPAGPALEPGRPRRPGGRRGRPRPRQGPGDRLRPPVAQQGAGQLLHRLRDLLTTWLAAPSAATIVVRRTGADSVAMAPPSPKKAPGRTKHPTTTD